MNKCRFYQSCSAPICPLDEDMGLRTYIKGEPTCRQDKKIRMKLGAKLKNLGLLPKEHSGSRNWNIRSEENQTQSLKRIEGTKFGGKK